VKLSNFLGSSRVEHVLSQHDVESRSPSNADTPGRYNRHILPGYATRKTIDPLRKAKLPTSAIKYSNRSI
jgi:hypothetical protein